jgi:hypothetical protein
MSDVKYAGQAPLASPLYLRNVPQRQGVNRRFCTARAAKEKTPRSHDLLHFIARRGSVSMMDLRANRRLAKQTFGFALNRPFRDGFDLRNSAMREGR